MGDGVASRLIVGLALLAGCISGPRAPTPRPQPDRLLLTFWCGPPLDEFDDRRAAEIAAAGFNVVGPPCEGAIDPPRNLRALELAARHGLKLWIRDPRFAPAITEGAGWETVVADAVREYRDHPSLGGYFVTDEPTIAELAAVGKVVARLAQLDPTRLGYVNLLADYLPPAAFGRGYRQYLDDFLEHAGLRLLSYDHYPLLVGGDRPSFFHNLADAATAAQAHGVPFILIVQAMPHGPYRDPTEAELSWQVLHALAHGAAGISYFAYWTPVEVAGTDEWRFRHGLIEHGQATIHYDQAARINRLARALAAGLAGYRPERVVLSTDRDAPFSSESGVATEGLFRGPAGSAALLVNRSYRPEGETRVRLRRGRAEWLDVAADRWRPFGGALRLPPGGALLTRWVSGGP
jgi:hypothetical protein